MIQPTHELQITTRQPPRQIPRPIHPTTRNPERIRHKTLRRQPSPTPIPPRQLRPRHTQLTHHTHRNQPTHPIHHPHQPTTQRTTHRHPGRRGIRHGAGDRGDGGLGGPVGVDHPHVRRGRPPGGQRLGRKRLAAEDQQAQRREVGGRRLRQRPDDRGPVGGRQVDDGQGVLPDDRRQVLRQPRQVGPDHHGRAGGQRRKQLVEGRVEGERGELQHPVLGRDAEQPSRRPHMTRQTPVRDRDTLRHPRRTRRIDDVGQIPRSHIHRTEIHRAGSCRSDVIGHVIQTHHRRAQLRRQQSPFPITHQRRHTRVTHHEPQPLHRIPRIQRHHHTTRPPHTQQPHHIRHPPPHTHPHPRLHPHPHTTQHRRQPPRPRRQLPIRQRLTTTHHRHPTRHPRHTPREHVRHRLHAGRRRVTGKLQQLRSLHRRQQLHTGDGGFGHRDDLFEHLSQVSGQPGGGRLVEQVGGVGEFEPHAGLDRAGEQREVEGRGDGLRVEVDRREADRALVLAGRDEVLQHEPGLEERVVAQVAARLELFHQPLEGQVLVVEGAEHALPHPGQQAGERRVAGEVGPDDEGVDKEADEPFEVFLAASGDRGPDSEVVLTRPSAQYDLECGEQHHEQCRAVLPAQVFQALHEFARHGHFDRAALSAANRRTRTVGGEFERADSVEGASPVVELPAQRVAGQPVALPGGEIGVLHAQFGQLGAVSADAGLVERGEFVHENAHRPAVGHRVVNDDDGERVVGVQRPHRAADQRRA